jgi:hypothetical protein
VNITSSTIDGSIVVMGIVAGLLALIGSLKLSEPTAAVQEAKACCGDRKTSNKAA